MHATSSPKVIDQQPAILAILAAALLAVGIALGAVMDLDLRIPAAAVSAPDTSYNAVEGARAQFGVAADTSYNAVEGARAQFGVAADTSYNAVEGTRAQIGVESVSKFGKSGYPSSRTHDELRAEGGWWASAPAGTVAGTPVSQADPNDRYGAGIR